MKTDAANPARTWKYDVCGRGSTALDTLEVAWQELRKVDLRIPNAVLTFVDVRSRGRIRGYFAISTWKKQKGSAHEIGISPKLIGHPTHLLATMLHEAAHAILYEAGKNGGIGSTPYYHTKEFRDQCFEFGLLCDFLNSRYGWTLTSWPRSGVPDRFKPIVTLFRKNLPAGTGGRAPSKIKGNKLPTTGHTMLVCGCPDRDRTIYVKKSVLEQGGVICSFCSQEFEVPTSVPADEHSD